ncbi:MAG: cation:proton antiporter [Snowella sp.]|nr:cation:proton antiporter [Snowella sp.]
MEGSLNLTLQIVITVLAGISAQVIAAYFKVPSIVFLLIFGIGLGSDGLHLLHPQQLGMGLEVIVSLSVAIILFEGGLNLSLRELGQVSGSLRNLVTLGTLITLAGAGMAAHWFAEFPWAIAFLYGSLVVVTGPTVVGPMIKQVQVERSVATLLEGEGVLIDPVGAILAVVVLETIFKTNTSFEGDIREILVGLSLRLGIGLGIGIVGGGLLSFFLKKATFLSDDLNNLVVLAGVWGIFGGSQALISESGLMATVATGIMLNSSELPDERLLKRFKGKLTILCVSVLFILLAADLSLKSVVALGWGSVVTVLCLMFIVRPISVGFCTLNSGLNWRQKLFVAWISPRGIVSASVASLFAILLTEQGINGGDSIKALVFLTIMMTVFIQGLTARVLAKILGVTSSTTTGAVIIGCTPLGRLIAKLFQIQGESVVLIDTDPEACQAAEGENIPVFQSSGLDPNVLEEAGINSMGTFMALTSNGEVNLVLAQRALEEFKPPRVYAVFPHKAEDDPSTAPSKGIQKFIDHKAFKTWNQYLKDDQVKLGKTVFREVGLSLQQAHIQALVRSGELLPLLVKRQKILQLVKTNEDWLPDEEVFYLLHDPRPTLLKRLSGGVQSSRLALAVLPEVEEVPLSNGSSEVENLTAFQED